ncbi:nucleolar protein 6 [Epargyreus clarus]|uniref:nucleolar protein 6 n=1 Tax=Epargyreus clarus TaxID=520877 RepID=UPI003C2B4877
MVEKELKTSMSEDDEANVNENGKRPAEDTKDGKKRIKTKSLYRQPTVNELNRLQETESLFNSNLFRLQIEEILQEVKVKEKTVKRFQEWFTNFKSHLFEIPEDDTEYDLTEKTLSKHLKVKIPVSSSLIKTKTMFKFHKFTDVEIVGSYALGTAISSKLVIDVLITVPAETYTKNDSINYRYHNKRAAYLAFIASHLNKFDAIEDLKYVSLNGCESKPLLQLKPIGKLGNHLSVRINLACEEETYKLHRFSPTRNNLRESWLFPDDNIDSTEVGPPTPYYNSSILSDLTASINQQFLRDTFENSENLRQAVVLLKIWLRQRKLQVSGHVVSLFVAYLVQAKRINNIMSSYQIVRNVWIALKSSEWDTKGISLHTGKTTLEEYLQHFPVVFLDRTGAYNVCWQMCKGTYCALRRECDLAVDMLDNGKINSFIPLFMTPVLPLMQFDHILRFKNLSNIIESVLDKSPRPSRVNYGVDQLALVTDVIYALLGRGLGDRVDLILQAVEADFSWSVKKTPDKAKKDGYEPKLSFGFILNPENAMNIVDKGPPANLPEAEEFRAFWGDKSELRRFQDGSITEACVWSAEGASDRRAICKQIVDYLFQLKYGIPSTQLFHICDQVDSVTARKGYSGEQGEEAALRVLRAFDELRRDVRALAEMPLDVSAVYGVSPVFSYCEPCPAVGSPADAKVWRRGAAALIKDKDVRIPQYTPVNHAVVELGHSGKWPGDIEAFRCLKAAFNLQIADRLTKQYSLPAQPYPAHIDVLKNGLVFRLQITHPKEVTLLRREVQKGVVKFKESEDSVKLQCDTVLMPRLRGALHGLHTKYPAYGPTVCVFKRWLSAHLLSPPHFPPAVAELLVATTFVHCSPLSPPHQPTAGLLRVLKKLVDTDWGKEMIVLDFNEDMTREEITQLERKFSEREPQTPCIHIVTAYDGELPGIWGRSAPTPNVLARAQTLAKATLEYVERALLEDYTDNILGAFVPSLTGYDVLIYLSRLLVPHVTERVDMRPQLRGSPDKLADDVIPVVGFNPVEKYLEELRNAYSEFAVFFHDAYGGDVIAVLWKPDIHEEKELQIGATNALKPVKVDGEIKYKVNIEALLEDFRTLGAGLVQAVVLNT